MLLDAGSERRSLLQRIETIGHCWARSRSRIAARPFTSVGRFSPLGPRGTRIARFWRRRLSRGGRAHWQRVDKWMMSLGHVLARWNLHFCAVGVFHQHTILIAPTALDFANALRHRSPLFDYAFCAARAHPSATFREFAIECASVVTRGTGSAHRAKHTLREKANEAAVKPLEFQI